jgi:hypothetical protein
MLVLFTNKKIRDKAERIGSAGRKVKGNKEIEKGVRVRNLL